MFKNRFLLLTLMITTFRFFACSDVVEPEIEETQAEEDEIIIVENGADHERI